MPSLTPFLLVAALSAVAACTAPAADEVAPDTARASIVDAPDGPPASPVVVELFTSEGCSSCPPADDLLRSLAERPDVIALSFHVDYWDRLGWRDPFSDAAYTARQRAYAPTLDGRVYTPEMVVGGTAGFVGSRRAEARTQIEAALQRPATASVTLDARRGSGRTVDVTYAATGVPETFVVHVALVQREASTRVGRGENGGRTLRHANVVRAFETRTGAEGRVALALPAGLDEADLMAVAYVQQGATGAIYGAATAPVE